MTYGNYPDLKKVKKILVVKLRHHGDVLLTSPLFSCLKKAIPNAQIDAFIYQDTLPMLEGHPAIANFLLYDKGWKKLSLWKRLYKEISLYRRVRKEGYDLVINLTEGDRGALLATLSKARYRVGFDPGKKGLFGKKKVLTHIVKNCPHPRHTVEKQLDVLRCIGIFPPEEDRDLFLDIPKAAKQKICEKLGSDPYIVLHPVSRWRFKCWPVQRVAELAKKLHSKNYRLVLSASPDPQEMEMVAEIMRLAPDVPFYDLAGQMTLKELGALLEGSRALVCVDSVPLHMASALKVPVVVTFGPSSDQNWGPWKHPQSRVVAQNFACRPCYKDGCGGSKMSDCLHTLPVSAVLEALESLGI